jgi:hypothetical protein
MDQPTRIRPPRPGVHTPVIAPVPSIGDTSTVSTPAHDMHRATLWLPLLRRLTEAVPGWVVIKNAEAALEGVGDIDSMADPSDWPEIERIFRTWAAERGLPVVGVCRHIWRGPNLIARDPASPYLLVLDVKALRTFRGSALVTAAAALSMAEMDPAGFRRLRPGAEGVLKLLHNGTAHGGRRNAPGLAGKRVVALLQADPEGADAAAAWVGISAPALRRASQATARGAWSGWDLRLVEAWSLTRSVRHPAHLARQLWLRASGQRCAFVRLTRRERRRLPDDGDAWIDHMRETHVGTSFLTLPDGVPG